MNGEEVSWTGNSVMGGMRGRHLEDKCVLKSIASDCVPGVC